MARHAFELPPGLVADETGAAAAGRWRDSRNVRFRAGRPEVIGGWESITADRLGGVCRGAVAWTDDQASLNLAFGDHRGVTVWRGGLIRDITPARALSAVVLAKDPLVTTAGSSSVKIRLPGHPLQVGEVVRVSGAMRAGRILIEGDYAVAAIGPDDFTVTAAGAAVIARQLGANPLSVTAGSAEVQVLEPAHGISSGQSVTVSGSTAVGGVVPNGTYVATVIDSDHYRIIAANAATATQSGGGAAVIVTVQERGGGSSVRVEPMRGFSGGAVDGAGGAGYGTGAYSTGTYSQPSAAEYFARTWSMAPWGRTLLANPRGGAVFSWDPAGVDDAAPLLNAPSQVSAMVVAPQDQVFALGCNEEASGVFNPLCIRHSSVRNSSEWRTGSDTTAREYVLPGGGWIVGGRVMGSSLLVWTSHGLYLGVFVGSVAQPWRFDRVGERCGLLGPNAAIVVGSQAFWISPDLQIYRYVLGGGVEPVTCPIRADFSENLAVGQAEKVYASSIASVGELRFDYPDARDGFENSRYIAMCLADGAWSRGMMARSALLDAGPAPSPVGVAPTGEIYWHERGHSADGGPIDWFIESADLAWSQDAMALVRGVWSDFDRQQGPVTLAVSAKSTPQGATIGRAEASIPPDVGHADLRVSGRYFRVRFAGGSSPARWRLGRPVFDLVQTGGR